MCVLVSTAMIKDTLSLVRMTQIHVKIMVHISFEAILEQSCNLRKNSIIDIINCHFLSILHNFKKLYKVRSILKVLQV